MRRRWSILGWWVLVAVGLGLIGAAAIHWLEESWRPHQDTAFSWAWAYFSAGFKTVVLVVVGGGGVLVVAVGICQFALRVVVGMVMAVRALNQSVSVAGQSRTSEMTPAQRQAALLSLVGRTGPPWVANRSSMWDELSEPEPYDEFWSPGPIVGWRVWTWEEGMLRGYAVGWPLPSLLAKCPTCPKIPGWDHSCGIYASKQESWLRPMGPSQVLGTVELSGRVIEHDCGYRAERADIAHLWVVDSELEEEVRRRYPTVRVSVRPWPD